MPVRSAVQPGARHPQPRLRLGAPDDAFEHEADRVAEQIAGGRTGIASALARAAPPPTVQRSCAECEERAGGALQRQCANCAGEDEEKVQLKAAGPAAPAPWAPTARTASAAPAVPAATAARIGRLRGGGEPLPPAVRSYFEPRLGRDLAPVRLHTGGEAAAAAREVRARAFTVGPDIAFAPGEYDPAGGAGRRLLAHELVHTVQQGAVGGTGGPALRAPAYVARVGEGDAGTGTAAPSRAPSPWKVEQQCGRDSRENTDFPRTHVTTVRIDVGNLTTGMTLTWHNPTGLTLPAGGFPISPGAGLCCNDCNDVTTSNAGGSLCTPKGSFRVYRKGCELSDTSWARNPTYFDESRSGIAIHTGPLPGFPASHGCVRTTEEASRIIHDNTIFSDRFRADPAQSLPDRRTAVEVTGTWSGSRCYRSASASERVLRSAACPAAPGARGSGTASPDAGAPAPGAVPAVPDAGTSGAGPAEESP
jgi:Domain of unknown function (DUF4157)/L,D-transpeptidase catalytic domain